ncbi:MAG: hypothetical protein ACKO96_15120 [Flammeovirgaceae bacterium]
MLHETQQIQNEAASDLPDEEKQHLQNEKLLNRLYAAADFDCKVRFAEDDKENQHSAID